MDLYEKNGNCLYILNVLKKYSDSEHMMSSVDIQEKVKEIYDVEIDPRTIRRNINLLKYKLDYDISTREDNGRGYYITRNPETDFEPGEIRAIIDTFSYGNYIVPQIAKSVISKCKNLQTVYENKKLKNYKIYANDTKTDNLEVIKNIEDVTDSINSLSKIEFEYWKYDISDKNEAKKIIVSRPKVTPYAVVYSRQQFYLIGIKEGLKDFYYYRLDRMKNIKCLSEKREIAKTEKEIRTFAESTVEMFGGDKAEVEAVCSYYLLNDAFEQFGKTIEVERIKNDDKNFKLKLNTNLYGFRIWAMRNLDLVEVIKPKELRDEIKDVIENAKRKYE